MSHEAHSRKTGGRQSRRERSGHTNPVQLIRPRFEHEHDAAVATLWRALARCEETPRGWPRRRPCEVGTSTRTIWLRSSALRLRGESIPPRPFDRLMRVGPTSGRRGFGLLAAPVLGTRGFQGRRFGFFCDLKFRNQRLSLGFRGALFPFRGPESGECRGCLRLFLA